MTFKLIFLHIPKTAGSTFHTILNRRFHKREIKNVFGSRYSDPEISNFMQMPEKHRKNLKLLKGHMPFGLHSYLEGSTKYMCFLRKPSERVVSQYYYIIKNAKNPLHKQVVSNDMSISEFVSSGIAIGMNNGQCRFINGDIDDYEFNQCDESLYKNVLKNINGHFLILGITERFDESVLVMAHLLGWKKPPYYFRENSSKIRKNLSQISNSDIETIGRYNKFDDKLYEYANKLLDDHIKNIPDFSANLSAYKLYNEKLQAHWGWLPDRLRSIFL
jgi:hypothetical protein